jgi:ribonuclease-3
VELAMGDPLAPPVHGRAVAPHGAPRVSRRRARPADAAPAAADAPPCAVLAGMLDHPFRTPALLDQALRHRSADGVRSGARASNEGLEFIGDRVLGLVVAEWLAERFPREREGDWGKRLSSLVARPTLARVAERLALGSFLAVPQDAARDGVPARTRVLADAMEAVLGALFLDGGLDPARRFIRRAWAEEMERMPAPPQPAKTALQEWALARGLGLPVYQLLQAAGPSHAPVFHVRVSLAGRAGEGRERSKRGAEQAAARALLAELLATA